MHREPGAIHQPFLSEPGFLRLKDDKIKLSELRLIKFIDRLGL